MTVLIVDDSRVMRLKLKSLVTATGLPVTEILEATHGGEALALLAERTVDAIFTDINMPVMDGRELIRQLHENNLAPNAVKVVCTTEDLGGLKEDCVRYGVTLYIEKPFDPAAVKRALMQVGKTAA
jgi:CheY-like chemotaxis protein